jgi:hypothetical protein
MHSGLAAPQKGGASSAKNVLKSIAVVRQRVAGDSIESEGDGAGSEKADRLSPSGTVSGEEQTGEDARPQSIGPAGSDGGTEKGSRRTFRGAANAVRAGARLAAGAREKAKQESQSKRENAKRVEEVAEARRKDREQRAQMLREEREL